MKAKENACKQLEVLLLLRSNNDSTIVAIKVKYKIKIFKTNPPFYSNFFATEKDLIKEVA